MAMFWLSKWLLLNSSCISAVVVVQFFFFYANDIIKGDNLLGLLS